MRQRLQFWVLGGDPRQSALAEALAEDGHSVYTYALEQSSSAALAAPGLEPITGADCVVLPLPTADGELLNAPLADAPLPLAQLLDALRPGQLILAGRVGPELRAMAQARGLTLTDYFAREELAVANAVPTSEGAIRIAMEELPVTLHGARVLVVGCGRIGKVLAQQLKGLGANVSVAARRYDQLAWARVWGCGAERSDQLRGWLCAYDLIVNTVPAPVLGREELADLKPGCLVIDLASKPGGVDLTAARDLGVKVIWALSLPGKEAPVTAALAIRSTIYNILSELGV